MGNKKTWFTSYFEEKSKNWRLLITRFKFRHCPPIKPNQTEAEAEAEEQHKHAMTVAIATAAAAEAAVASAFAAAEVVRLTNNIPSQSHAYRNLHLSTITIQSAYRGYLARKALSALKGIVKLQALVRGELVRGSVVKRLVLQHLLVRRRRSAVPIDHFDNGETRHSVTRNDEELNLHLNNNKSCDLSLVSKEEEEALCPRKQDASYSSSLRFMERRNEQESVTLSRSNRFDPCTESKYHQHGMLSHSKDVALDTTKLEKLKLRGARKQGTTEGLMNSSFCHVKQKSIEDDRSLPNSPVLRAYMAPTESAKAKSKSLSTPRQRLRLSDAYYGQDDSPHKLSVSSSSLLNSFNGEVSSTKKRNSISQ